MKKIFYGVTVLIIVIIYSVFFSRNNYDYIDFNNVSEHTEVKENDVVSIGMISVTGGSRGYATEKELVNYIGEKLGKKVKFIQRKSYKEINNLLKNNEIDIAFLSTGSYALYDDKNSLDLIARPNRGKSSYHPVLIVKNDSSYNSLEDLENKDFAFVDTYSYSGYLVISDYLKHKNTTIDKFFNNKYYFTYSHEQSVRQVVNDNVKGAVVDDWTLQYLEKNNKELYDGIKVIKVFDEVSTGPVVTKSNYEDKEKLRDILFKIGYDINVKNVLEQLQIDKYDPTHKEDYPSLIEEDKGAK